MKVQDSNRDRMAASLDSSVVLVMVAQGPSTVVVSCEEGYISFVLSFVSMVDGRNGNDV